ncbi:hypothetical protein QYE76_036396 [Lolium multiflorum]|uniref:Retrotransposon gag domain-containing protein n=1 Tax=Lolium multiflorum TaxID=4521 RepID=A0AAD8VQ42_LOLMU|nr:hypothetical protein QYE76_036396 [Lolium multiflorum]
MQCLQLYLKDSARAWLRGLPKGSIKSWDDLVEAFVANFQATYKRPVGIEELRHCQQKQKESMRSYIGRFTKLLNAVEDVSVDRAIDAFSDVIRRQQKDYLDACSEGCFTSKEVEAKWDLLDRIEENAEGWENNKGEESGYADKPPFKPLPPKEGNEEREEKKKKGTKKKKKKKKKKKENKEKEVTAYPA